MPDLLHIIPRGDNSMFNWVRQFQYTTLALCFISNVGILRAIPTIEEECLARPTIDGNTARGASSPANPLLTIPDPLSTTRADPPSASSEPELMIVYILCGAKTEDNKMNLAG